MKLNTLCFSLLFSLFFLKTGAQTNDSLPYSKPEKAPAPAFNPKEEVEVGGKRFRVYNNWLNVGFGEGLNTTLPFTESVLNVDLHFHIGPRYFQLGTFLSGDRFLSFNNYNIHLCYGKRWENVKRNIYLCAGPSYSYGFPFVQGNYENTLYNEVGLYVEAQYTYKLAYDLGLGLSVFDDINSRQNVYGLRVELYFSGAYRGAGKKKASWMK
jgi:hypothetical protein